MKEKEEVPYNKWVPKQAGSEEEAGYGPVLQEFCGENRFISVVNILEFYIDGTCELEIQPRDAIQTQVRMEWTMAEFFDNGGTTSFIDRLCGSLGIHASTVKVVGVAPGSVQVDYEITPTADEPMSLEQISARQTEQFATGQVDLGAPVLDVVGGGESIVADGVAVVVGFPSVVLVPTATNAGSQIYLEWIEPFLWEAAQVAAIDVPAEIAIEFLGSGLIWLWNELAQEVYAMAEQDLIQGKVDAHVPNVAPEEVEPPVIEDDGNVGDISGEDFGTDL